MLIDIGTLIGRFHPLIVHLPIGFLLMAVFFALVSLIKKYRALRFAAPVTLLIGSISAAFACITGYVLSLYGDYEIDTLDNHMWAGIFTTITSFVAYLVSIKKIPFAFLKSRKALVVTLIIILVFINVTGHLGGSLTHGSDYLSTSVFFDKQIRKKKISNINDAYVFADLVQPILENKCGSCHNSSKKKGKLSMESYIEITKGGKHGAVIKPGNPAASEIIKRVSLNPKDKKFMPSDGKPPLNAEETAIIKWWIEKAAGNNDKKMAELNVPEEIKKYTIAYLGIETDAASEYYNIIKIQTPSVGKEVLNKYIQMGYVIKYLNMKPDLLDVTLPSSANNGKISDKLKALLLVKNNIIWLNVSGNNVSDNEMEIIKQFKNLERLKLDKNPITDKGIVKLQGLSNLKSINLYDTKITKDCLPVLSGFPTLKTAYVWRTGIQKKDISMADPDLKIISGN